MPELDESWFAPDAVAEPPLRKFAPDEMVTCNDCLRANPPTRVQCMYCGASLNQIAAPADAETTAAALREEANYYVVVQARADHPIDDSAVDHLAARFHLKPEELRAALNAGALLPLAAASSEDAAQQVISDLKGVNDANVSLARMNREIIHVGIRALEFDGSRIAAVSKIGRKRLMTELIDLRLIVTGRLVLHRVEVDERRSRNSVKPLDRRELSQDQPVIDLYLHGSSEPWRIVVNDFDFSCLGERKGLTAYDNVKALIEGLQQRTPATVNESYARARPVLNHVWPLQNTESQGRSRRPRASRKEFSTVTASDNEAQFNNYSRLVWCMCAADQPQTDQDV